MLSGAFVVALPSIPLEPKQPHRKQDTSGDRHFKVRTRALASQGGGGSQSPSIEYCSNAVSTTKYTVWNFFPKNIFEQFRKLANVYFGIVCVLQVFTVSRCIDSREGDGGIIGNEVEDGAKETVSFGCGMFAREEMMFDKGEEEDKRSGKRGREKRKQNKRKYKLNHHLRLRRTFHRQVNSQRSRRCS